MLENEVIYHTEATETTENVEHEKFIHKLKEDIGQFKTGRAKRIKDDEEFVLMKDEKPMKTRQELECELLLSMMEKKHGGDRGYLYWKDLKKRIPTFKKETFKDLSKEDKDLIQLLNNYTLKLINQSIKNNIEDMKAIMEDNE